MCDAKEDEVLDEDHHPELDVGTDAIPGSDAVKSSLDRFPGHDDLEDCDDRSGSSRSLSPTLPPPMPAPGDLPSVYFESSLEADTVCESHEGCSGDLVFPASRPVFAPDCPPRFHCYHGGVCRRRSKHRTANDFAAKRLDPALVPPLTFPVAPSSFSFFGLHAEPSPVWKRKSGSAESSLEEWDPEPGGRRPWSEVYPGSTTSSEDAGSVGSGDVTAQTHHNHHHHHHSHSHSASSTLSTSLSRTSDRQRKRAYRIGLNLFNRCVRSAVKSRVHGCHFSGISGNLEISGNSAKFAVKSQVKGRKSGEGRGTCVIEEI